MRASQCISTGAGRLRSGLAHREVRPRIVPRFRVCTEAMLILHIRKHDIVLSMNWAGRTSQWPDAWSIPPWLRPFLSSKRMYSKSEIPLISTKQTVVSRSSASNRVMHATALCQELPFSLSRHQGERLLPAVLAR